MADSAYHGKPEVIIPLSKPSDGTELPDWKKDLNAGHPTIRAGVEHVLASVKTWKILRDHRRTASALTNTASGMAHLHNVALTW
jgi:hypothetical protein